MLCMRVEPTHDDRAAMHASVHAGSAETLLVNTADAIIETVEDGSLMHMTVREPDGRELLSLTLRFDDGRRSGAALYARTPLLAEAGFTGGRCDPPRLTINRI